MLAIGRPLIVLGMVTAPPEPVYPEIVIVPLLVVQVNWACPAAGSASNSSSSLVAQASRSRWQTYGVELFIKKATDPL
jgi:hypothetical protein